MDFVAIDFETANADLNSVCSMGLVFVSRHKVMHRMHALIQPPDMRFDAAYSARHGITADTVQKAPTFDVVWRKIAHLFNRHCLVVSHDAPFDVRVLAQTLAHYGLPAPTFDYFCSMDFTEVFASGTARSLRARCDHFGVKIGEKYPALSNATACAQLVMKAIRIQKSRDVNEFLRLNPSVRVNEFPKPDAPPKVVPKPAPVVGVKISPPPARTRNAHPLVGKNIAFTGDFDGMSHKDVMRFAETTGAIPKESVSKNTDFLVVATPRGRGIAGLSVKEKRAQELMLDGSGIRIIREADYLRMLRTAVSR